MAFGNESHVRVARQASAGVAASASFFDVPIISETMVVNIPPLISDTIRARYEEGPVSQGIISPGGDISARAHPTVIGTFLRAFHGTASSTLVGAVTTHVFLGVQSVFDPDVHLTPYTIEVYRGTDEAHFFHDSCLNRFTLDVAGGQFLRTSASFISRTHSTATKGAPSFPEGTELTWNQASVSLGGAASTIFDGMTFSWDNALTTLPALDGTKVNRRVQRGGVRALQVTGTIDFQNNDEFDKFRAGTEQRLKVTFTGATLTTSQNELLVIDVPTFRYDAFPVMVGGPGRIVVGFTGRAVWNTGSGLAWTVTLVNTQPAY